MHPTDRKSYIYASVIAVLATMFIILSIVKNVYSALFYAPIAIYVFAKKRLLLKHKFLFFAFVVDIISLFFLFFVYSNDKHDFMGLIWPMVIFAVFLFIIIEVIYNSFLKMLKAADIEKKHYEIIDKFPHLICHKHRARTEYFNNYIYDIVHCRVDKNCLEANNLKELESLVGIIAPPDYESENDNEIILWDSETGEIRNGDYDVIKIIETKPLADYDYDYVINKVVRFFYNELERYQPMDTITIQIIGNPEISKNTKRLLAQNFRKVEYIAKEN